MQMDRTEKFWDSMSKNFDNEDRPTETIDRIANFLDAGDIVLDCGCATGTVAIALSGSVKKVLGIDISQKMIDAAKSNAVKGQTENVCFKKATLFDLDSNFEEETFDVVIALNVLHLLGDTQAVMRRIHALLKPGGLFISETVCIGEKIRILSILTLLLSKTRLIPQVNSFKITDLDTAAVIERFKIVASEVSYESGVAQYFLAVRK